jgi:hypothetical protein
VPPNQNTIIEWASPATQIIRQGKANKCEN